MRASSRGDDGERGGGPRVSEHRAGDAERRPWRRIGPQPRGRIGRRGDDGRPGVTDVPQVLRHRHVGQLHRLEPVAKLFERDARGIEGKHRVAARQGVVDGLVLGGNRYDVAARGRILPEQLVSDHRVDRVPAGDDRAPVRQHAEQRVEVPDLERLAALRRDLQREAGLERHRRRVGSDERLVEAIFTAAKERNRVLSDDELVEICKYEAATRGHDVPMDTLDTWKREVEEAP